MAVGLLGGTFDPIHLGHLDVARAAREALGLSRVLLIPTRVPSHRRVPHASAAHRFAMTALAAQHDERLGLSDIDMTRDEPAYTIDTVARLRSGTPPSAAFCFVTGADAFKDIRSWKMHEALLDGCDFAVVSRPGLEATALPALLPELASRMRTPPFTLRRQPGIFLVDAPTAPVSSTGVRRAIAEHGDWQRMVPPEVATYITRHGLYGASTP